MGKSRCARFRVVLADGELSVRSFARKRPTTRSPRSRVHCHQVAGGQLLTFPLDRVHNGLPGIRRDALPLLPLADDPVTFTDGLGHLGKGVPHREHISNGFHSRDIARDSLSRQEPTSRPVTAMGAKRTIRPMGRATTPATFKKEFCQRLKAARIMAGYDQAEFAKELGLLPNTYNKYETRSLLPHFLIPRACEILGIDTAVLFVGPGAARRKTG